MALTLRVAVALTVRTPTVLGDEVEYFLAARQPPGHAGLLSIAYPPLYPAILAAVAGIGSSQTGYLLCRLLSAVVSSAIVPLSQPLWGPAGLLGGCLVALLPAGMITSGLLLSENLFAPLLAVWLLGAMRWNGKPSHASGLVMGLSASAAALTRAAGGAVMLATLVMVMLRRNSIGRAATIMLALAPVAFYLALRQENPPQPFNDPLAVVHPHEITRALSPDLGDLTQGTLLEPVAARLPWPYLFTIVWGGLWCLQYTLYLALGTGGLALVFLDGRIRRESPGRHAILPLLVLSAACIVISANHNLAGEQANQFVRGRYIEPLLPLWFAAALGALATRSGIQITAWALPACCLAGIASLTASQNRAADFLYPLRSTLLSAQPLARIGMNVIAGIVLFLVARLMLGRASKRRLLITAFVGISLLASVLRFHRQHSVADGLAAPARWLAAHDPQAPIEIVTDGQPSDSLKASGLWWAVQHIRFFSANPLTVSPETGAGYSLLMGKQGVVCTGGESTHPSICLAPREWLP